MLQVADYDKKTVVSRLLKLSSKLKLDYGDYLAVKAKINLPFAGYPLPLQQYVMFTHDTLITCNFILYNFQPPKLRIFV